MADRPSWRQRFVRRWWASHNDSRRIREAVQTVLAELRSGEVGLNIACGDVRLHANVINADWQATPAADLRADAHRLPFAPGTFRALISQETVEHLADPFGAVREMARVLRPGGVLYIQVPFLLGYHPGPEDYWRFTGPGVRRLLEQGGLSVEQVEPALGAGTGLYRVVVEFLAGVVGRGIPAAYHPVKGALSLLCFPLRALDGLTLGGAQRDRIPGGNFGIGRKPG